MERRYLLLATRTFRGFAYGVFSVILLLLLINSGLEPLYAGLVVTVSILLNSFLTFTIARRYGHERAKQLLLLFSALLTAGIGGIYFSNLGILKAVSAIVGSLGANPSDNTLFSSYEQPIISGITENQHSRNKLFSFYTFAGYSSSSVGAASLVIGASFSIIASFFLSFLMLITYLFIPVGRSGLNQTKRNVKQSSRIVARDVSLLFSLDAIGGGFVLQSLLSYWFKVRYGLDLAQLGYLFVAVDVITAFSVLITPMISRRIGLLRTMVFTHLPSNVLLMMIPLIPNLYAAITLLLLRQCLSQMDVPTRQSYINSIVASEDRSYVVGSSNASRSVSQASTPYISSYLISLGASSIPFIAGGSIKIVYDLLLYRRFKAVKEHY